MDTNDKIIGEKVRQARAIKGLSQKELGKYLKVNKQAIYSIEKGIRRLSASELNIIAEATNQPLSFFYDESNNPQEYRRITLGEGARDLSDLTEDDLKLIDEMIKKLRERYFGEKKN